MGLKRIGVLVISVFIITGSWHSCLAQENSSVKKWVKTNDVWVDATFIDSAYPVENEYATNPEGYRDAMNKYKSTHPQFPSSNAPDYMAQLERWVVAYKYQFPHYIDTGNPELDKTLFLDGLAEWTKRHPDAVSNVEPK